MTVLNSAQKARGYVHYRVPNVEDIDHGNLAGLAEDDHPQYLNEARGDARYYTETEVDTLLAAQDELSELGDVTLTTPATGSVLYKSGTDWINTDAVSIDPLGAVEMQYNGLLAGQTGVNGLKGYSTSGTVASFELFDNASNQLVSMFTSSGNYVVRNVQHGGLIHLQAEDAGGVARNLVVGDPDGSVDLYYDGVKAVETHKTAANEQGILISDDGVNDRVAFILKTANLGAAGGFQFTHFSDGNAYIDQRRTSGKMVFRAVDSGGANHRTCLQIGTSGTVSALAFHGTNPIAKPSVTGSRGGNAALASLLTQLANYGLITNSTTA